MAAAVKKTRKELLKEPDEFITLSSRLIGFIATYKNTIVYAEYAVMLAVTALSAYIWYSGRQEAAAAEQLGQALAKYERLKAETSPAKAVQEVAGGFRRILGRYGNHSIHPIQPIPRFKPSADRPGHSRIPLPTLLF